TGKSLRDDPSVVDSAATCKHGRREVRSPSTGPPDRYSERLVALLAQAADEVALGQRGGLVLERLQHGLAVFVRPRQLEDALLRLAQLLIARLDESDALLVAGEGLVQSQPAVLQVAHHALQLHQGVF